MYLLAALVIVSICLIVERLVELAKFNKGGGKYKVIICSEIKPLHNPLPNPISPYEEDIMCYGFWTVDDKGKKRFCISEEPHMKGDILYIIFASEQRYTNFYMEDIS